MSFISYSNPSIPFVPGALHRESQPPNFTFGGTAPPPLPCPAAPGWTDRGSGQNRSEGLAAAGLGVRVEVPTPGGRPEGFAATFFSLSPTGGLLNFFKSPLGYQKASNFAGGAGGGRKSGQRSNFRAVSHFCGTKKLAKWVDSLREDKSRAVGAGR